MVTSGVTAQPSTTSSATTSATTDRRRRARLDLSPVSAPYQPQRRVRQDVRDGLAVIAASAGASTAVALIATLLVKLVG